MASKSLETVITSSQVKLKMAEVKNEDSHHKDRNAKHQDIVLLNVGGKRYNAS